MIFPKVCNYICVKHVCKVAKESFSYIIVKPTRLKKAKIRGTPSMKNYISTSLMKKNQRFDIILNNIRSFSICDTILQQYNKSLSKDWS